jgi:hypothetical protein
MKVTLGDIRKKFDALQSGGESREEVADFALRAMQADDAGTLEMEPVFSDKIWKAIIYLSGVDLKDTPALTCTLLLISWRSERGWEFKRQFMGRREDRDQDKVTPMRRVDGRDGLDGSDFTTRYPLTIQSASFQCDSLHSR